MGVVGTFAIGWLLPRLAGFKAQHPHVDLRLKIADAIEGKSHVLCTLDDATATLQVNRAILRSAETSSWQSTGAG